jgi:type I restriction enzyme S subunit
MNAIQQLLTDHIDIWTAADIEKKSGRGRSSGNAANIYGIKKLRELILELAVRGKLVPQDPNDEPASELLKRIQAEKATLIAEGKIKKDKPLAPIAEKEQPFELPRGWKWVRLGVLTQKLTDGSHNPPKDAGAGFPMLSSQNVNFGKIDFNSPSRYVSAKDFEIENSRTRIESGDVLLTIVASLGRPAVVPDNAPKFVLQRSVAVIKTELLAEFLCLHLGAPLCIRYYNIHGKGTAQKGIYLGQLSEMPIAVPPIEEQHRIVVKVDELMALCDQLETQHCNAAEAHEKLVSHLLGTLTQSQSAEDFSANWQRVAAHFDTLFTTEISIVALKQTLLQLAVIGKLVAQDQNDESGLALMNRIQCSRTGKRKIVTLSEEIFTSLEGLLPSSWTWTSIDQISADDPAAITDGPFGANLKTEHYVDQPGFRVVRLQNIGHGEFRDEHRSYVEEARFEKLKKHQVYAGDLIVAGLIDTSIRCCAAPKDIGQAIVKADCYRLSVNSLVSAGYVLHYLNSIMAHEFAAVHHHGLTLTRIGLGNFRSVPIPIPPLAEQHRIVAKVDELMAICDQLKTHIIEANQLQQKLADVVVEQAVN